MDILYQSASGLWHLHTQKLIHRDFRCDNVLVYSIMPLSLRVTDFGLSHRMTAAVSTETTATVIGPVGACAVCVVRIFCWVRFGFLMALVLSRQLGEPQKLLPKVTK